VILGFSLSVKNNSSSVTFNSSCGSVVTQVRTN
jgi:hypothetical protein